MRIGDIASRSIVYDSEGPVGISSERDLVQAVADGAEVENTRVREYITASPVEIGTNATLVKAIGKMSELAVRHLAVVEDEEIVGMISARDILKALHTGVTTSQEVTQ